MGEGERGMAAGGYDIGGWDADGSADLTATGPDEEAVLLNALTGLLAVARGGVPPVPEAVATAAAPIRGQGADLPSVAVELANDLLARLDADGTGLDRVRLDGLLATDDGGYTAWGYALGRAGDPPPAVTLSLDAPPSSSRDGDVLTLRFRLRRG